MSERPKRNVYVTLDGKVYHLLYNLYGLKDAAKVFNDGLVEHLRAGGYIQSQFDQCLFFKWTSIWSSTILIFHVDDFNVNATSEQLLDDFRSHMQQKYEVTSNTDGVFLGIHLCKCDDGSIIFRRPTQLQSIFDKHIQSGVQQPVSQTQADAYYKHFDVEDSTPCDATAFRSLIGALMQHTDCRPDIQLRLAKCSQRECSPRVKDMDELREIVQYL